MKNISRLAAALALVALYSCSTTRNAVLITEKPEPTLEEKVGRMIIVGMRGTELKKDNPVIEAIQDRGVGGIIFFEGNVAKKKLFVNPERRLTRLCRDLQALSDKGLMIGIDQEGGRVMRLKPKDGFPEIPPQAYLGELDNEDSTRYYAGLNAEVLSRIGINTNFTPSIDVNINPECPPLGKIGRTFSADPEVVTRHGSFVVDEHRKHGVYTSIKHFPGHGSSVVDSHKGFTDVTDTWQEEELIPFAEMIKNGMCDMVMVGHVFHRQIDSLYPASLSDKAINGLLRGQLGWDGLVITDDMRMRAIKDNYSFEESAALAINAGVDMVMLVAGRSLDTIDDAINDIVQMVKDGKIPESRIDEAVARIDKLYGKK